MLPLRSRRAPLAGLVAHTVAVVVAAAVVVAGCAVSTDDDNATDTPGAADLAEHEPGPAAASPAATAAATPPATAPASAPIRVVAPPPLPRPTTWSPTPAPATSPGPPGAPAAGSAPAGSPATGAPAATTEPPATAAGSESAAEHRPLAGRVIVLDPGHNGANAAHPEIINASVPAGFGRTKACNTTGTATNDGYPEHAFTWAVAQQLAPLLVDAGASVVLTRDSDDGVGPCVNQRAEIGNSAAADAVVSIHGDGAASAVHGFFVMTSSRPPADDETFAASAALADAIIGGMVDAGLTTSTGAGVDGRQPRSDLAGLNLSLRPTVMIECGNMRNAGDAALMSSPEGQARIAAGIAAGITAFLTGDGEQ